MSKHLIDKLKGQTIAWTAWRTCLDATNAPIVALIQVGFDSGLVVEFRPEQTSRGLLCVPRAINPPRDQTHGPRADHEEYLP